MSASYVTATWSREPNVHLFCDSFYPDLNVASVEQEDGFTRNSPLRRDRVFRAFRGAPGVLEY